MKRLCRFLGPHKVRWSDCVASKNAWKDRNRKSEDRDRDRRIGQSELRPPLCIGHSFCNVAHFVFGIRTSWWCRIGREVIKQAPVAIFLPTPPKDWILGTAWSPILWVIFILQGIMSWPLGSLYWREVPSSLWEGILGMERWGRDPWNGEKSHLVGWGQDPWNGEKPHPGGIHGN